jgi:hypothetical protein
MSTLIGIGIGPILVGAISDALVHTGMAHTLGPALAVSALAPLGSILAYLKLKPSDSRNAL